MCITSPRLSKNSCHLIFGHHFASTASIKNESKVKITLKGVYAFPLALYLQFSRFFVCKGRAMTSTSDKVLQNPNMDPRWSAQAHKCYRRTTRNRRKLKIEGNRESKDVCLLLVIQKTNRNLLLKVPFSKPRLMVGFWFCFVFWFVRFFGFLFFFPIVWTKTDHYFQVINHDCCQAGEQMWWKKQWKTCNRSSHHFLGMSFWTQSASALIRTGRENLGEQL